MGKIRFVGYFKVIAITDYETDYCICNINAVTAVDTDKSDFNEVIKDKEEEEVAIELDVKKVNAVDEKVEINETNKDKIAEALYATLADKFFKFNPKGYNGKIHEIKDNFTLALCNYIFNEESEKCVDEVQEELIDKEKSKALVERKEYEQLFNKSKQLMSFKKALEDIKGYVLCQDEQIKKILYSIYNNIKIADLDLEYEEKRKKKQNILIAGPTGTGKTEIALQLARIFDLPIVIEDMTRFTEAGYVGADIESVFTHLINAAGGDIERAQKGILVLDEIDKLASTSKDNVSRDGVQNALLKILDGGIQMFSAKNGMSSKECTFDTSGLTIIGLGAFEDIDKIRDKRIRKANKTSIGFSIDTEEEKYVEQEINSEDYIEYGINSQIVGRFHTKASLNQLGVKELIDIMKNSKTSVTNINIKALQLQNVKLTMTDDYYEQVAIFATKLNNGARSINTVVDHSLEEAMIELFDDDSFTELVVTGETVKDNKIYTLKKGN